MFPSRVLLGTFAAALSVVSWSGSASAFCRTTTCKCKSTKGADPNRPEDGPCPQDCPRENWCQTTGKPVAWDGRCVGFSLNLSGSAGLSADQWTDAIVTSFETWAAVDCGGGAHPSIDLTKLRDVTCAKSEYNPSGPNVNVVYFDDNGWDGHDIDGTIATTKVHFDDSGTILDADMAINSARHDFTVSDTNVQYDLVSVVTHETGHFLGLDHSTDSGAVMFYSYNPGSINRQLSEDDRNAICTAYPPDRKASCNPTPRGALGASCPDAPKGCTVAQATPGHDGNSIPSLAFGIFGFVGLRRLRRHGSKP